MDNFKEIHIGKIIELRVIDYEIDLSRICNFLKCSETDIVETFASNCLPTDTLLKWCKLLEYDFFRLYSQHLILYAPHSSNKKEGNSNVQLPNFRKNIYTREIIDFIVEKIKSKEMTKTQVMDRYKIPKTTLYKWINKYK